PGRHRAPPPRPPHPGDVPPLRAPRLAASDMSGYLIPGRGRFGVSSSQFRFVEPRLAASDLSRYLIPGQVPSGQTLEGLVELGVGDRQRRRRLDQRAVGAGWDDEDSAGQRLVRVALARTKQPASVPAGPFEALTGLAHAVEQLRHL